MNNKRAWFIEFACENLFECDVSEGSDIWWIASKTYGRDFYLESAASSTACGDNEVGHAVCLKAKLQMHNVVSNANDKIYTTMIYPCFSGSACFSMGSPAWWRFGLCSNGSSLVVWCRDAPLVREFQLWHRRSTLISVWMWSTISWKYFIIYLVRLFSTENCKPEPSCIIFSTVYWLLLQHVNHRQQPVTSRLAWPCYGLVSTVF